jgi:hypothetical protein
MGRENFTLSSSVAIAVASSRPIQIGRVSFPSNDFKIMIGAFDTGSIVRSVTFISCNMGPPPEFLNE